MSKFLNELKRRNVIKATIAYLVVAWVLLQVFTVLLPILSAPDWILKGLTLLLAIGLPIWIIVSWIYDITPQGIEKTSDVSKNDLRRHATNKRLNAFIIASLSVAVVVMGLKLSGVFSSNSNNNYAIAVLAFDDMSPEKDQEYFSDGVSEDIINMLAQVPNLKVMGRTSSFAFKGKNIDLKVIGEQLNVSHILEGSVRKSGNKLRITAQLVNLEDGSQLFSEEFDRELEDVFDIQDEISEEILKSIKIKLLGTKKEVILKNYTENIEAYQLFLNGRYFYNQYTEESFLKAIDYFKKAIEIDPDYAIAYASLANCYFDGAYTRWFSFKESIDKSIEFAEKSIQIDDNCSECNIASGRLKLWYNWNFKDAIIDLEKGVAINPNSVEGNKQLGVWHMVMENYEEANEYLLKTDDLDAFSLLNLVYIAYYHLWDGDYEVMQEYGNRILELAPNYPYGYSMAGTGNFGLHKYEDAIINMETSLKLSSNLLEVSTFLVISYLRTGNEVKAQELFEKIKNLFDEDDIANYSYAFIYATMGEWDLAYEYLNRAVINHEGQMLYLKSYFRDFHPDMKDDPRTIELIKKIGLPLD
jgi:TolB-like protein/Tfp pilus assembly protein PilF